MKVARRPRYLARTCISTVAAIALLAVGTASGVNAHQSVLPASAPRAGGTVAERLPSVPDCLDPARSAELTISYVANAFADPLITQDSRGKFVPDLATSWKFSHGGKWLTLQLRHGVRFSNGHAFNAAAVRWNLERKENAPTVGPLASVRTPNRYEVQVILSAPYRPLLSKLAFSLPILDPNGNNSCTNAVGTGPFKISSVGPGYNPVTMTRNTLRKWDTPAAHNKGPSYLSKIVFKPIPDAATTVSELVSGGVDVSPVLPGDEVSRVTNDSHVKLYKKAIQDANFLLFNTAHAPFNNPAVRRAIAEAIDRSALIKVAANGLGIPDYSVIPPTMSFYDKQAKKYAPPYNPTAAQRVLSANHVTGPYTLLIFNGLEYQNSAEFIQSELSQVGVKVNIVNQPLPDFIASARKGDFDLGFMQYNANDPDFVYSLYHSSQETGAGLNFTAYHDATLDQLIIQGRETVNAKKAAAVYAKFQRLMNKILISDPLFSDITVTGVRTRVKGWHTNVWGRWPWYQDLYVSGS